MKVKGPTWLVPSYEVIDGLLGKARTVAAEETRHLSRLRDRKWRRSAKGRAWYAANRERNRQRQRERYRKNKEHYAATHKRWREANRKYLNFKQRMYYYTHLKERRAYLNRKAREYRAARKAAQQ